MGAEGGNLRIAWEWMAERGQVAELDRSMAALCYFYKWLGQYQQGERLCQRAVEGLAAPGDAFDPERARVRARALAWQGVFCHRLGRHQEAWALLQRSLDRLEGLASDLRDSQDGEPDEIQRAKAFALWRLGNVCADIDHQDPAPFYRESLVLYRGLEDGWGMASVETAWGRNRLRI
jgi:tetratricopeptide (TPR) repeat protein